MFLFSELLYLIRECVFFLGFISGRSSFPPHLPPSEERKYLLAFAAGDQTARAVLIERNLRLVAHVAKKFINTNIDQEDLISIGTIGLIKAVGTFKIDSGTQLATYAARCIENEILMQIRSGRRQRNEVSLHEPIGVDREGNEIGLVDILGTAPNVVADEVEVNIEMGRVLQLMQSILTKRERLVIQLRYGLLGGKPLPQREIAKTLAISRSYVSRIGCCKQKAARSGAYAGAGVIFICGRDRGV